MPSPSFFAPAPADRLVSLPPSITRSYIQTPSGPLELLTAAPASTSPDSPRKQALFFAHGGCGSAAVWAEWMDHLAQRYGIPCYAVSYRGHGASWYPWYLRMYFTTARTLAGDLVAGLRYVQRLEGKLHGDDDDDDDDGGEARVVLVAHSNGGGLAQIALGGGLARVAGLALVAATPCYGSIGVNKNWSAMDRWFMPRMYLRHLGNPMSPLSSAALIKQAFFSPGFPLERVAAFRRAMPAYESFLWPLNLMFRVAHPGRVLAAVVPPAHARNGAKLLVLAGERDRLMSLDLMERQAAEYKAAAPKRDAGGAKAAGVRFEVVHGAGHHLQNDLQWEEGANVLLGWYNEL